MSRHFAWLLAACSSSHPAIDAAVPDATPDAAPDAFVDPRLPCLGRAAPSTAPDPLPVSGKLFAIDHYNVAPLAGGIVVLHARATGAALGQATTAADGSFTIPAATGGTALASFFSVTAAGYRPSIIDPGDPLHGGEDALLVVATDAELGRWYTDSGSAYTPGDPTLIAATVDCDAKALGGTTMAFAPATGATYYNDPAKRWDPALAASTNGFTLVPDAPPALSATAHLDNLGFPPVPLSPASGLTLAVITPHARP